MLHSQGLPYIFYPEYSQSFPCIDAYFFRIYSNTYISLIMSNFLIRSATSPSISYPIVLTRLGGHRSRPNPHLKFVDVPGNEPANS